MEKLSDLCGLMWGVSIWTRNKAMFFSIYLLDKNCTKQQGYQNQNDNKTKVYWDLLPGKVHWSAREQPQSQAVILGDT